MYTPSLTSFKKCSCVCKKWGWK